jgi:hypothetical protein
MPNPYLHAVAHGPLGGDALALDNLAAPSDNTKLNVSTASHGLTPKLPGDATQVLQGDGTYAVPSLNNLTSLAWTAVTLTITSGAGAITTQSSSSSYLRMGKTVFVSINVSVSNIGTASGNTTLSGLPVGVARFSVFYLREVAVNGLGYSWSVAATTTSGQIATAGNNANPTWANNINYVGFAVYESV